MSLGSPGCPAPVFPLAARDQTVAEEMASSSPAAVAPSFAVHKTGVVLEGRHVRMSRGEARQSAGHRCASPAGGGLDVQLSGGPITVTPETRSTGALWQSWHCHACALPSYPVRSARPRRARVNPCPGGTQPCRRGLPALPIPTKAGAVEGAAERFLDGGKRFPAAGGNIWIQLPLHVQPAGPDPLLHGTTGVALPRRDPPAPCPTAGSPVPCPHPTRSPTILPWRSPRPVGIARGCRCPSPASCRPVPGRGGGSRCPPRSFCQPQKN